MSLTERPVEHHSVPLPGGVDILHPERTILRFADGDALDIGALCYHHRGSQKRRYAGRVVATDTLDSVRAGRIRELILLLSRLLKEGGMRQQTVYGLAYHLSRFLDWADKVPLHDVLTDKNAAAVAFRQYVGHLRERVNQHKLTNNSASMTQHSLLRILSEFMDADDLHLGINLLQIKRSGTTHTSPPDEAAQAKLLALSRALFEGISTLVLDQKPYPFPLEVPPYLGLKDNTLWMFPARMWCEPPHLATAQRRTKSRVRGFDYANGRLSCLEELAQHYSPKKRKWTSVEADKRAKAKAALKLAMTALQAGNSDLRNCHRHYAAQLAHNAFVLLFLAHTGMNWATVRGLPWSDIYEVGVERQGFRAIKYRAAGRMVSFEIQPIFLPVFKRFLELRTFLLDGEPCDCLFIGFGLKRNMLGPMSRGALTNYFDALRKLDPLMPVIMSKQWRAGKSDWLIRNSDPATAALILQNSESTVLRAYAAGSETQHMEEMSTFFERVEEMVVNRDQPIDGGVDRAVGVCASFGDPHQTGKAPVAPDCRGPEGCLFCDQFKVHADERDTRKLLSCRYCLQQTAHLASSEEHFQSLFGPIFERICFILEEIDRREAGLVERIRVEVEEDGELDPYWASKLEMLAALELVA